MTPTNTSSEPFERTWTAVAALGRIRPDPDAISSSLEALPRSDDTARSLAAQVDRARVVFLAERNLRSAPPTPLRDQLLEYVSAEATTGRLFAERVKAEVGEIVRRASAVGGHLLKGLAMRTEYPEPSLRHFGDIDLHFDDFDAALPFLRELRGSGWDWDANELPWMKWSDDGVPYGQWSMVRTADPEEPKLRIDAHVGPYSVGYLGLLPLDRFRTGEFEGIPVDVPDPAGSIAVTAAHAMGNYFLHFKDINDVAVVAERHEVDPRRLGELVVGVGAERALAQISSWVRTLYGIDVPGAERGSPERPLPRRVPSPRARALFTTLLTFRQEKRQTGAAAAALRMPGAFAAYTRDTEPRRGRQFPSAPTGRWRNRRSCWRFVPASVWRAVPAGRPTAGKPSSEELVGGLRLLRQGRAAVARLGDDVFIPTVDGALSPRALSLAADGGG